MTTATKTANEIAALFFAQKPEGGFISARQFAWLYGQMCHESGRADIEHGRKRASGMINGRRWTAAENANHSAVLRWW